MSFLLFLVSGGLSTLLDLVLFSLLIHVVHVAAAYLLSYLICVIVRFGFDARYTFSVDSPAVRHFWLYLGANIGLMLMGLGVFHLLGLYFSPVIAKVLSIPPVTVTGFVVMNRLIFPRRQEEGE